MKIDFDRLEPQERRIVLVASDVKYDELVNEIDWRKVVLASMASPLVVFTNGLLGVPAATIASGLFGLAAKASGYLASTWSAMEVHKEREKRSLFRRIFTKGELPIPHLSPAEAARRFKFDVGGPEDGTAYLLNPCVPQHYMPLAMANERLAQEKLAAFMQIASALGARKIELASGESLESGAAGGADVPLPKAAGQIGLAATFSSGNLVKRRVLQEFGEPLVAPHVPEEFEPWLDMDPTLRATAKTRLAGNPKTLSASLEFGRIIDVTADLSAKIADRGISVGGKYREVASTRWSFEIEFWPKHEA